jgi:hypothetical protein
MNKWKVAFFVSMAFAILILMGTVYLLLSNTITSGHNYDNILTIAEDIDNISKAIQKKANTIHEFDKELSRIDAGHGVDTIYNTIHLQIALIIFDEEGKFERIKTHFEARE